MKKTILFLVLIISTSLLSAQSITSTNSSSSSISVSVSSNNNDYTYSAVFDKEKTKAAKNTLVKILGKVSEETDHTSLWKGKGYSVSIRQGKVKMKMNKDEVTKSFQVKFENLGEEVSESIGSVKAPQPPDKKHK